MRRILSRLPEPVKAPLRRAKDFVAALPYRGTGRWCPVCEKSSSRFKPFGNPPRADAMCPHCGALERHRLAWLYLQRRTDLFDGRPRRVLHVAPELCLEPRLRRRLRGGYLTADLDSPRAAARMDVTDIRHPDESFDVIFCSHVLEHVPDDRRAMAEFFRVLRRGGWAILLVPITADATYEDPTVVDPAERLRLFGQEDHVRRYGPDYVDRLRQAGFEVATTRVTDLVSADDAVRMALTPAAGDIFHCTRPRRPAGS
ncbi:MAG TPA: methyltransferase domain-containing protein [Longimicrobium sp.]|nr:methyltransferase domain-containing protein [Longimicrobium sp.]